MSKDMPLKRSKCQVCRYPEIQCICDLTPSLSGPVKVWILQDKKEAKHAKNTARLFVLGYEPAQVVDVTCSEQWHIFLQSVTTKNTVLLYPDVSAKPIETLTTVEAADYCNVVLLDGTWRKARKMLYTYDVLSDFPKACFLSPPKSDYVIRKAPNEAALSTFEAAAYALEQLIPDFDRQSMAQFFAGAVSRQWAQQPEHHKHLS